MQSTYEASFEREMGCTPSEWLGWLPAAIGAHPWQLHDSSAQVQLDGLCEDATLTLHWHALPPRVIALARIPRLQVRFSFHGLDAAQRYSFMKRFDLYLQRGGG